MIFHARTGLYDGFYMDTMGAPTAEVGSADPSAHVIMDFEESYELMTEGNGKVSYESYVGFKDILDIHRQIAGER